MQIEEIFLLTHEVQALHGKLSLDFIQLSHQEALFCMGVQATGYEKATWGHPDRTMAPLIKSEGEGMSKDKLDEAIEHLREAGGVAWLDTNSLLFSHTLDYQNKMIELITNSQEAIQALHECIWKVVSQVMEDTGKSVVDGLGIALHLVDMLPTIPLQLAFNIATAGLLGCAPKVYAAWPKTRTDSLDFSHAPPPGSDRDTMAILHEEILKSAHGTEEKAIQPTWLLTMASVGSVGMKAVENEGIDNPNYVCISVSPVGRASYSPILRTSLHTNWHAAGPPVPHSPSHSPPHSLSLDHRCRGLISSSSSPGSSSGSESGSGSTSGSGSSSSSGSGLDDESDAGSREESQAPQDSGPGGLE